MKLNEKENLDIICIFSSAVRHHELKIGNLLVKTEIKLKYKLDTYLDRLRQVKRSLDQRTVSLAPADIDLIQDSLEIMRKDYRDYYDNWLMDNDCWLECRQVLKRIKKAQLFLTKEMSLI